MRSIAVPPLKRHASRGVDRAQMRADEKCYILSASKMEAGMFLDGKTVVVIGGSRGIGLGTAKAAKAHGANVVITGRTANKLSAAQGELGAGVKAVALDSADEAGTKAFFAGLAQVDHLVITAATVQRAPLTSDTEKL